MFFRWFWLYFSVLICKWSKVLRFKQTWADLTVARKAASERPLYLVTSQADFSKRQRTDKRTNSIIQKLQEMDGQSDEQSTNIAAHLEYIFRAGLSGFRRSDDEAPCGAPFGRGTTLYHGKPPEIRERRRSSMKRRRKRGGRRGGRK